MMGRGTGTGMGMGMGWGWDGMGREGVVDKNWWLGEDIMVDDSRVWR